MTGVVFISAGRGADKVELIVKAELEQLRRIEKIVHLGEVKRITANEIELEGGSIETSMDALHIDCSASGISQRMPVPVFDGGKITLQ